MQDDRTDTREKILNAAYKSFYRQGFSRVSVDLIAERAGVTKRTVYYHFKSKDDIVAEVLEVLHRQLMPQFSTWIGTDASSSAEMVERLFSRLQAWVEGKDWLGSGFTRIATELADMPGHPARQAARRHKAAVEAWLEEQLRARGVSNPRDPARQVMILTEGAISLTLIHGDAGYIRASADAALRLVAESENPG